MVVEEIRNPVVEALAAYLRGEIDNFALDDALFSFPSGKDRTADVIACNLWYSYDDCVRYKVSLSREGFQMYRRCIAFLRAGLELPEKQQDTEQWPFVSRRQIIRLRPTLRDLELPKFDPVNHQLPIGSSNMEGMLGMGIVVMVILLLSCLFLLVVKVLHVLYGG